MFWRGVVAYLPVQAVNAAAGFAAVAVFTRLLTPEQYGQYALALAWTAILHTVLMAWVEAAMDRFHVAEAERGEAPSHLATLYWAFAGLSVLAALAAALGLMLIALDPAFELAFAAAVAAALARTAKRLIQKRRRAEGDVRHYAVTSIGTTIGGLLLGIACAEAGMGGAAPIVGGLGAALAFLLLEVPKEIGRARGGRLEPARVRRYAAYGVPLASSLLLGLVLTTADRLLIGAFMDEAAVGAYQAGYTVANRSLDVMFVWLGLAGAPAAVAALEREGGAGFDAALRAQAQLMALLTFPAAAGLALVAEPLSRLMVGPELQPGAARVIPWIALAGLFAGWTTHYFGQAFTLGRRPVLLILSMAPPATATVGLNLLLIPRFGLDGAMWATTASFGVAALSAFLLGRRAAVLPLPLAAFARSGVATAVMSIAVAATPASGVWELAVKVAVGAFAYGAALTLLELAFPSAWGRVVVGWLKSACRRVVGAKRATKPA